MELLNYDLGMPAGPSGLLVAAHTTENLPRIILTCMVTYAVTLAIYRFYLHPLRAFPGPRLAAFTFWLTVIFPCSESPMLTYMPGMSSTMTLFSGDSTSFKFVDYTNDTDL